MDLEWVALFFFLMPTQTYIDNSRGKVVNIIPKRTIRHALNPNALKTEEEKKSNPLKIHQNTLVSHLAPKLPSASNFFDVLRCSHMGLSLGYTQLYLKIPTPVY
jgi:hypothetical protein